MRVTYLPFTKGVQFVLQSVYITQDREEINVIRYLLDGWNCKTVSSFCVVTIQCVATSLR